VTKRFGRTVRADTDITVPIGPLNLLLTMLVSAEAALVRHVPMPIGSSLLVVARKENRNPVSFGPRTKDQGRTKNQGPRTKD